MNTKYCAICEAEATNKTEEGTPICATCHTAYEWGRAAFYALRYKLEKTLKENS